jgi:hypothetical protein
VKDITVEYETINFFENLEVKVSKSDKTDQDFQYQGNITVISTIGNKYSTSHFGESTITVGKV